MTHPVLVSMLVLGSLLTAIGAGRAADDPKAAGEERRAAVGKCLSPLGSLLAREAAGKPWQALGPLDTVYSRDLLVALAGGRAALKTTDGAVQLTLWGNLPELSPHPMLESAVVLHAGKDLALDFTLERGRVVVTNQREKGPARVRARVRDGGWELTLNEPGASVALELYGRWPRGVPFGADSQPTATLDILVLNGSVELKSGPLQHALKAPPGPAFVHWDSIVGADVTPQRREEVPPWATRAAKPTPEAQLIDEALARFGEGVKKKAVAEALADLLESGVTSTDARRSALTCKVAVHGLGALDDLPRLIDALDDKRLNAVREPAIETLRHWIGRAAGQDALLKKFLVEQRAYSAVQAEAVLQLLHSFGDDDVARPQTYDALLAYLQHERLALRTLAHWHLRRLVPGGKDVAYDPAGASDQQKSGAQEWKKRVGEMFKKPEEKK